MNWNAVGAIGEVVGAFAVVVTVAYLAIQIRNESARAKREHRRDRTSRMANAYADLSDSDYMPHLLVKLGDLSEAPTGWKSVAEATGLEPVEAIRYSFSRQGMLHSFQDSLLDMSLEPAERDSVGRRLKYTIRQDGPAFVALWAVLGATFLPDFQAAVEKELSGSDDTYQGD